MTRAIIYCRVSTEEQEHNNSLPSQLDACRRYAEQQGATIVAELQDVMSGAKLDRPGLTRARSLVARGEVDALIVHSADRLTRSLAHSLLLRDELRAAGVQLHTVARGQASADTPEGGLLENIEATFGEYERLKIRERVVRGKNRVAEQGRVPGDGGHALYGYRFEGERKTRRMVIDPEPAHVVANIFSWYTSGIGIETIVQRLEAQGTPTPEDIGIVVGRRRQRPAGDWPRSTVYRILKNETYTGVFRTRGAAVPVPAIVDRTTFDAAQDRLAVGRARSRRNGNRHYLLRCRVRCGDCGHAYSGYSNVSHWKETQYEYRYYRCIASAKHVKTVHQCFHRPVKAEQLEHAVWQWIADVVLDENHLRAGVSLHREASASERSKLDKTKIRLYEQRVQLNAEIARFYDRWAKGKMTDNELDAQIDPRKVAIARLDSEIAELDRQLTGWGLSDSDVDEIAATARELRAMLADNDIPVETRQRILDLLDLQVRITQVDGQIYADMMVAFTCDAVRVIVSQNVYNLIYREEEREMLPLCRAEGIGVIPWSPLARGFLTGNRPRGTDAATIRGRTDNLSHAYYDDADYTIVDRVGEIATRHGVTPAQVATTWILRQPGITAPIVGASKMAHLEQAVAALNLVLSDEDCAYLEEPYQPHPVLGHS